MDKQPTEAQLKKFWEWCGFEYLPKGSHDKFKRLDAIRYPDNCIYSVAPPIDLNNLFKYATPKFLAVHKRLPVKWMFDKDPALALFWAIWEVIHNDN